MRLGKYVGNIAKKAYKNGMEPVGVALVGSPEMIDNYCTAHPDKAKIVDTAGTVFGLGSLAGGLYGGDVAAPTFENALRIGLVGNEAVNVITSDNKHSKEKRNPIQNYARKPTVLGRITQGMQYLYHNKDEIIKDMKKF